MKKGLFLDRDGVLTSLASSHQTALEFLPGVLLGLASIRPHFDYAFIVTNQTSIGLGHISLTQLYQQHQSLLLCLAMHDLRIDRIYCAVGHPRLQSFQRKPQIGMALQAKRDYPLVDLQESWMIGDQMSDMRFARDAGIGRTILICGDSPHKKAASIQPDYYASDLIDAAYLFH